MAAAAAKQIMHTITKMPIHNFTVGTMCTTPIGSGLAAMKLGLRFLWGPTLKKYLLGFLLQADICHVFRRDPFRVGLE